MKKTWWTKIASAAAIASIAALAGCGAPATTGLPLVSGGQQPMSAGDMMKARAFQAAIAGQAAQPVTWNNRISLHPDREAFPELMRLLDSAKKSIYMETFELHNDDTAVQIVKKLVEKHQAGVEVRVIIDRIGLKSSHGQSYKRLIDAGVPTVIYGPFPYWRNGEKGLNITHRKLYLVDGDRGLTGGMNLGDHYFVRDHDMLWKVEGEAAYALHKEFATDWKLGKGAKPVNLGPAPTGSYGSEPIGVAVTSPREKGREQEIYNTLIKAVDNARTRIDMGYPFFWDDRLVNRLIAAEARGVQVRVIMTKFSQTFTHMLDRYTAKQAGPKGVDLKWYSSSRYAHIKYTAIDDSFLAIGSSNGDSLTFYNNQELDLLLTNPQTVALFRSRVSEPDWANGVPVTPADYPSGNKPLYSLLELIDKFM